MEDKVIEELIKSGKKLLEEYESKELNEAYFSRMAGIRRYSKKNNERQLYNQYMVMGKLFIHYDKTHDIGEKIIHFVRVHTDKMKVNEPAEV